MEKADLTVVSPIPSGRLGEEHEEELLALLAERTGRYTMGDSTSVRAETAVRLLNGILFCLELEKRPADASTRGAPTRERFFAGVREAQRLQRRAALLYAQAKRWEPSVVNLAYSETLDALAEFFRRYDPDFFAQDIPCAIDYPLCQPVSERLAGVEYMLDYLRRWLTESAFLRALDAGLLRALYEGYYGDYNDLLVNLYLPAAEAATLCALADQPVRKLLLSTVERENAARLIWSEDGIAAQSAVLTAARRVCEELGQGGGFARTYAEQTALDLFVRLRARREPANR